MKNSLWEALVKRRAGRSMEFSISMPTAENSAPPPASLSFEQAKDELEAILERMDNRDCSLDEMLANYERGTQLLSHCQQRLSHAQQRVEQIRLTKNGKSASLVALEDATPEPDTSSTHAKRTRRPAAKPEPNDDDDEIRLF
jgi:exodeoxyribonuclease VII small subunit